MTALTLTARRNVSGLVWTIVACILTVLILWPVGRLIMVSFQDADGVATVANYVRALTAPRFRSAAWNSLVLATSVGVLSVLVATPMAWVTSRTDMPGRRTIDVLVLGSLVTPGFLTSIAWIFLGGPNAGLVNVAFRALTGSTSPLFDVFSMKGMVFVTFLECFPFAYIIIAAALKNVAAELEDAASMLGAGRWHTMRRITIPLVMPAVLAGFILSFLEAFALFSSPAMIGVPAQIYVLTTQIWALFQFPPELGVAAALALPLLLVTIVLLLLQRALLGRRGYVTVTGKVTAPRLIKLGWARWVAFALCALVVTVSVGLTYLVLATYATSIDWKQWPGPGNFTVENFRFVLFGMDTTRKGLANSMVLATLSGTLAVALGGVIAYVAERRLVRGASFLGFLAMAPMVVPSIVFAVGLFAAYTRQPLVLYGTLWILLVAYLTKFLPLAYMNASTAVKAIGTELEEAARISGASSLRTFSRITFPLIRNGALAGWLLVFTFSLRELSSSILLFTNNTMVISVSVFDLYETGSWAPLSALGCILLLINLVVIGVGYAVLGGGFLARTHA
ncbi:MAG: iron ABC transporter permease [Betaproteobacteria bacterium]|nr:iron ABC transporter permease [Betaproteobacteria bacterium]